MEKNQLFLVLPIVDGHEADDERLYLNSIDGSTPSAFLEDLLKHLVNAFSWVSGEAYDLYYDHQRFLELYKKSLIGKSGQRPSPLQLLGSLSHLTRIPKEMPPIYINDVAFSHGIVCCFVNTERAGSVIVDQNALLNPQHLQVKDNKGNPKVLHVVNSNREEIFKWFVNNRLPLRKLDPDYAKHSKQTKLVNGKVVSACTYSEAEYREMLPWAVGSKNHRRKYVLDSDRKRLVVFMDENLSIPTFHYFDVEMDDVEENGKMQKDCSRPMVNQIKAIPELRRQAAAKQ